MTRETIISKLQEHALYMRSISALVDLLHHYSNRSQTEKAKEIALAITNLTAVSNRDFDDFDAFVRSESLELLQHAELMPALIEYGRAKAVFTAATAEAQDYDVLSAELLGG